MANTKSNKWESVTDVLNIIKDPRWWWSRNSRCKYITLRIDTRDQHCLITNNEGDAITLKDLARQIENYHLYHELMKAKDDTGLDGVEDVTPQD